MKTPNFLHPLSYAPVTLYLELSIGQMSAQETTIFECPFIGDDLNARDRSGSMRWTLERLRTVIDRCSNPPQFRGVKTPITELFEQEKDKKKLHSRATEKMAKADPKTPTKRPAHELSASLPAGLKRPDLTATVDGKLIASEFQRQLFDDIKHGNCVRCHSKEHAPPVRSQSADGKQNLTRTKTNIGWVP